MNTKNKPQHNLTDASLKVEIIPHKVKSGVVRIKNIKNIIAVTSGKGGVGKSTIALNLAISLQKILGANLDTNTDMIKVGILDADIYGPSIPTLVGEKDFKPEVEDTYFLPLEKFGLKILSFGFLIAEKQPVIWRGAIVNKALEQLLYDTKWGELDFLIIDMPPGTGDIHLSMCQKMPITAVITVTTPQDMALVDVKKSIAMYQKMDIPCLGIIENMSTHICNHCGHSEAIFGTEGGDKLASEYNLDVLERLPLNISMCESCDIGIPITVVGEYENDASYKNNNINNSNVNENQTKKINTIFNNLAQKVLTNISILPKDYSAQIGKITVVREK